MANQRRSPYAIQTSKSPEEAQAILDRFLQAQKFRDIGHKEKGVFQRGIGILQASQFVKVLSVEPGWVRLEAWITFFGGEQSLDGIVGALPKSQLQAKLGELVRSLE